MKNNNKDVKFGGIFDSPNYAFGWMSIFFIPVGTYMFALFPPLLWANKHDPNIESDTAFLLILLIPFVLSTMVAIIIAHIYSKKLISFGQFPIWLDTFSFVTKLLLTFTVVYAFCNFIIPRPSDLFSAGPIEQFLRLLPLVLNVGTISISYIEMKQKKFNSNKTPS